MPDSRAKSRRDGHFADEDWLDFARGQGEPEQRKRLEQHLATGCPRCAEAVDLWRAAVDLASQEADYRPPEGAVRQLRAHFAQRRSEGLLARAAQRASLIFDSFRQPALVGVRAAGPSPRQLLYKAGRYAIRLRVEAGAGTDQLSVVGQVMDEQDPRRALPDLAVLMLSETETVDRTLTNRLGEFQLEAAREERLRLSIALPEIHPFTVPLAVVRRPRRGARA
jgi:anti-sigma factor RsiW